MLLIFSFVTIKRITKTVLECGIQLVSETRNSNINKFRGYDQRFNETLVEERAELNYLFRKRFYQLNLLRKLETSDISTLEKIQDLEVYDGYNENSSKYSVNLKAGGLFKDWESDI
jgi:hypothetical protein